MSNERLLLAGLPEHHDKFKSYWWCHPKVTGYLTDFIPDNIRVTTVDPMPNSVSDNGDLTHADYVTSLWDPEFQSEHKDVFDYVVLPDLNGPWYTAQTSTGSTEIFVDLMKQAMNLVKPGGCGIFDKILNQLEMKKYIESNEFAFTPFMLDIFEKKPGGHIAILLTKRILNSVR